MKILQNKVEWTVMDLVSLLLAYKTQIYLVIILFNYYFRICFLLREFGGTTFTRMYQRNVFTC